MNDCSITRSIAGCFRFFTLTYDARSSYAPVSSGRRKTRSVPDPHPSGQRQRRSLSSCSEHGCIARLSADGDGDIEEHQCFSDISEMFFCHIDVECSAMRFRVAGCRFVYINYLRH